MYFEYIKKKNNINFLVDTTRQLGKSTGEQIEAGKTSTLHFSSKTTKSPSDNRRFCLHSETIKALEKAVRKRDRALSTALLQNEGFSFDFALVATIQLMGGED